MTDDLWELTKRVYGDPHAGKTLVQLRDTFSRVEFGLLKLWSLRARAALRGHFAP